MSRNNEPCQMCGGSGVIRHEDAPDTKCGACEQKKFEQSIRTIIVIAAAIVPLATFGAFLLNYPTITHVILQEVPWDWLKSVLKPVVFVAALAAVGLYYWIFSKVYKITLLLAVLCGLTVYVNFLQHNLVQDNRAILSSLKFNESAAETHTTDKHKKLLGLWKNSSGNLLAFINTGNLIRISSGEQFVFDAKKWNLLGDDIVTFDDIKFRYTFSGTKLVLNGSKDATLAKEYLRVTENKPDGDYQHRLSYAKLLYAGATFGSLPVVKYAHKHGGYLDRSNWPNNETALIAASKNGHKEIVLYLLKNGADILSKDDDGKEGYDHAVMNGHNEIKQILEDWYRQSQSK